MLHSLVGLDERFDWGKVSFQDSRLCKPSNSFVPFPLFKTTNNFGGIIACRVFIGLPEAAFYPGAIFLLSRWYTKKVIIKPLAVYLHR